MSNAADGYLGDWLPHKPKCGCVECQLERSQDENYRLRKALDEIRIGISLNRDSREETLKLAQMGLERKP